MSEAFQYDAWPYSEIVYRWKCDAHVPEGDRNPELHGHLLIVRFAPYNDDIVNRWRFEVMGILEEYKAGAAVTTASSATVDYSETVGFRRSKEHAQQAARDAHRKLCKRPIVHRYDDDIRSWWEQ